MRRSQLSAVLVTSFSCLSLLSVAHAEWPQWRGPNRDDVSTEKNLLQEWPEGGPPRVWMFENAGVGYSGPAIVGDRLYTMGAREGKELLLTLDANTGVISGSPTDPPFPGNQGIDYSLEITVEDEAEGTNFAATCPITVNPRLNSLPVKLEPYRCVDYQTAFQDMVALLEGGTITHVGTHAELLATVPRYRYLLSADDELDDGCERDEPWQADEAWQRARREEVMEDDEYRLARAPRREPR